MLAVLSVCSGTLGAEAGGAGPGAERGDPTLPLPLKGQPAGYYSALAKVHTTYGLYKEAEVLQQKAIELENGRAKKERLSYELYDLIYCKAGWWDKAAEEIVRTMSLAEPGNAVQMRKYHMDRARALNEAGRPDEYIVELETLVQLSADEDERERALRTLHQALERLGKLEPKIEQYEAAVRKNPKDVTTLRILAGLYYGSGLLNQPAKAIEKIEQIRQAEPKDVNAAEQLARLYVSTKRAAKAVAVYEDLMDLNERRFEGYFTDAIAIIRPGGKDAEAIAWCEKIAKKYPKKPEILVRIGNIHNERGELAKAAEQYQKAIALLERPIDKLPMYFRLIECQLGARKYAEAEQSCREAKKLDIRVESMSKRLQDLLDRSLQGQGKPRQE